MAAADVIFLVISIIAVGAAALAVTRKNPIYSALFMMVTLLVVAAVFQMLSSPFLAVMQVLLYAGAIMVLFTFVIMLLSLRPEEMGETAPLPQRIFAAVVALGVFALLAFPAIEPGVPAAAASLAPPAAEAVRFPPAAGTGDGATVEFGATAYFGHTIFGRFVLPFELVSILVLAAVVAVMVLAKRDLSKRDVADDGSDRDPPPLSVSAAHAGSIASLATSTQPTSHGPGA